MSLDPIGDLRHQQRANGEIVGFRIRTETATNLGINIQRDERFELVNIGINVAVIWDGVGFQWITFDNIDQLTWNLSSVNIHREQTIDDNSGDLMFEHGTFFRFMPPRNNVRCRTCPAEFRIDLPIGMTLTTNGFDNVQCPNGHRGANLISQ